MAKKRRWDNSRKEEERRRWGKPKTEGMELKGGKGKMGEEKKKFVAPKTEEIKIEPRVAKMPIFKPKEEVSDECLAALRAASEVIGEKCKFTPGTKKTVEIEGVKIEAPSAEVEKLKRQYHALTFAEKVAKMEEESEWLRNMSEGWIRKVLPFYKPGTAEFEKARKAFAHSVAEGIVSKYAAA